MWSNGRWMLFLLAVGLAARGYGMGGDHPRGEPVRLDRAPSGLEELINRENRIGGFFVNADDIFFYAGDTAALDAFLKSYAALEEIPGHLLVIHQGKRYAQAPWDQDKGIVAWWKAKRCDWTLETGLVSWQEAGGHRRVFRDLTSITTVPSPPQNTAERLQYYAEVHVWTASQVDTKALEIPKSVTVLDEAAYKAATDPSPPEPPSLAPETLPGIKADQETRRP